MNQSMKYVQWSRTCTAGLIIAQSCCETDYVQQTLIITLLFEWMVFSATILHCMAGYTGPRDNLGYWDEFAMNHATGAGSIAQPVDQQASMLPLCYECSIYTAELIIVQCCCEYNNVQQTLIIAILFVWQEKYQYIQTFNISSINLSIYPDF